MNKKIKIEIAVGVIAFAAIVFGGAFWVGSKNNPNNNPAPAVQVQKPATQVQRDKNIQSDKTTDWKTYRDDEYGFEISYPKDWKQEENVYGTGDTIEINKIIGGKISFDDGMDLKITYLPTLDTYPDLQKILDQQRNGYSNEAFLVDNYMFNGFVGVRAITKSDLDPEQVYQEDIQLFLKKGNGFYKISWNVADPNKNNFNYKNYLEPILSTFKFTNGQANSDWKTYTNDKYNYKIDYPSNWFIYDNDGGDVFVQPAEEIIGTVPSHSDAFEIKARSTEEINLSKIIDNIGNQAGIKYKQENVKIADLIWGIKATSQCEGLGCGNPEWFVIRNGVVYHFNPNLGYDNNKDNDDKILASLKFIN